jgi:transcriptional regulator with XRE-family HTH domain
MPTERGHKTRVPLPYLRAWRESKFVSRDELAAKSGVSKSTIVRLEINGGQGAILSTVGKLAVALGITREQLVRQNPRGRRGLTEGKKTWGSVTDQE